MAVKDQIQIEKDVLFFDGVCNLCNGFVDFVIRRDTKGRILFSSLQSQAAEQLVPEYQEKLSTVVLYRKGRVTTKSTAALSILASLGGAWGLAKIFLIIPRFFRDWVYDRVANHRYKWFGERETCRIPSPEERARFLETISEKPSGNSCSES